jgi:hypothetical protein
VAAVALAPVGIDIEAIRPRDPRLLGFIASEAEAAALRGRVGNASELLTLLWTLKEAAAKASGLGLGLALRQLPVTPVGRLTYDVGGWTAVTYRYERFLIGLAFQQSAHGRPPIRWYQPRRLPVTEIAEIAVGIETLEAGSFQRRVSL